MLDLLGSEVQLRSKRDLIEKFIAEYLPNVSSPDQVEAGFSLFWNEEREKSVAQFCDEESLKREDVDAVDRRAKRTRLAG